MLSTIESGHEILEGIHMSLQPMLVIPKPWLAHNVGGYLSVSSSIMRVKGSKTQLDLLRACDPSQLYDVCTFCHIEFTENSNRD